MELTTENYAIQILMARYYSLKEKNMKAKEEMIDNPNQYSHTCMDETQKLMGEILIALHKLGINI